MTDGWCQLDTALLPLRKDRRIMQTVVHIAQRTLNLRSKGVGSYGRPDIVRQEEQRIGTFHPQQGEMQAAVVLPQRTYIPQVLAMAGGIHPQAARLTVVTADVLAVDDHRRAFVRAEGQHLIHMPDVGMALLLQGSQAEIHRGIASFHAGKSAQDLYQVKRIGEGRAEGNFPAVA